MHIVSLIGKPNVGKSTIFNILIKEKKSIIDDEPGITRDRIYGTVNYLDKKFTIIDTGGIEVEENDINNNIKAQAMLAIDESDTIIFVLDGKSELSPDDYLIRDLLKRTNKKIIVLVNKLDNDKEELNLYNYYELGFSNILPFSGAHKKGIKELLSLITKDIKEVTEEDSDILKFAIIGRPNVGKSSLVNALLNEERVIVSPEAFTTRDAVDTKFKYDNNEYIAIDTAGMRKQGKIYEKIEKYSLIRSLRSIERSDVSVLVIDASTGIIEHDKHIISYAIDSGKGIVIAVNKWDLITNPNENIKKWQEDIKNNFQFIPYAKVVFLSAKTKKRIHTLMPQVIGAYENNRKEIKTSVLNQIIIEAATLHAAPGYKGKRLKIYFTSQTGIKPPKFTFSVNNKNLVHFSYKRYLENKIRENIDLSGTPIILQFKNKDE